MGMNEKYSSLSNLKLWLFPRFSSLFKFYNKTNTLQENKRSLILLIYLEVSKNYLKKNKFKKKFQIGKHFVLFCWVLWVSRIIEYTQNSKFTHKIK